MAWRPTNYLIEGELDNTTPGKVTGWMRFAGRREKVTFDLTGDFHRDIRGARIYLTGDAREKEPGDEYMQGFSQMQTGQAGDITAGLWPYDYVKGFCYIEWFSQENGRVVLELESDQVQIIGKPLEADKCEPISRERQAVHMAEYMRDLGKMLSQNKRKKSGK